MNDDELITIPAGARLLGVSEGAVYRAVKQKKIPTVQIGPYQFIRPTALRAWNDNPASHRRGPKPKKKNCPLAY